MNAEPASAAGPADQRPVGEGYGRHRRAVAEARRIAIAGALPHPWTVIADAAS